MSNPDQPNNAGDNPYQASGQGGYGGRPGDPFAAGQPGGYPPPQGGYPGGGQPYAGGGGYANYPGGQGSVPPQPATPNTVTYAFWCWIATTIVSLVGLALTLTSPIWDLAAQEGARQSGTNIDVNSLITSIKIVTVVIALIFVAVYLLFAFKMRAGRNWARIVLTVFGALTLLSAFTPTSRTVTVNNQVFDVNSGQWATYLTAALALAGIVLMFLAPSNAYFVESKRHRQAKSLYGG